MIILRLFFLVLLYILEISSIKLSRCYSLEHIPFTIQKSYNITNSTFKELKLKLK